MNKKYKYVYIATGIKKRHEPIEIYNICKHVTHVIYKYICQITCCPSYTKKFIHAIFSSKLSYKDIHGIINKHLLIFR